MGELDNRRGRARGHQLSIGEINIRGVNDVCKRILVEEWAQKHELDIVCVAETKHAHASIEGEQAGYIEDGIGKRRLEMVSQHKRKS